MKYGYIVRLDNLSCIYNDEDAVIRSVLTDLANQDARYWDRYGTGKRPKNLGIEVVFAFRHSDGWKFWRSGYRTLCDESALDSHGIKGVSVSRYEGSLIYNEDGHIWDKS